MNVNRRRGVVLLWVVLGMMVMVGMIGLACDYLRICLIRQQLQHSADASALGGAMRVRVNTMDLARQWAQLAGINNTADRNPVTLDQNHSNGGSGDIVIGRYYRATRTFVPTLTGADAVRTRTHRPDGGAPAVELMFGPIFGTQTAQLGRQAVAMNVGGTGAAILVLREGGSVFTSQGDCTINVTNGAIQVNSTNSGAIKSKSGAATVNAPDFNIVSDIASPPRNLSGNFNEGAPRIEDPLVGLAPPVQGAPLTQSGSVINPGYYPNGLTLHNGSLTLNPGVYIVGGGIKVNGGTFTAQGVLIYVVGGSVDISGNANVNITPMTSGPYAGLSLWEARLNHSGSKLNGTADIHIGGTIYFPEAELEMTGTGDGFGNQIIANTVSFKGTCDIDIDYQGANPTEGKVFLVE